MNSCGNRPYSAPEKIPCEHCGQLNTWTHIQLKFRPVLVIQKIVDKNKRECNSVIGLPITSSQSWQGYIYSVEVPAQTITLPKISMSSNSAFEKEIPSYILVDKIRTYDWNNPTMAYLGSLSLNDEIINQVNEKLVSLLNLHDRLTQ